MTGLRDDFKKLEISSASKKVILFLIVFSALVGIFSGIIYWITSDLPNINLLEEFTPIESSRVYSSDGKMIAELYVERRTFVQHY